MSKIRKGIKRKGYEKKANTKTPARPPTAIKRRQRIPVTKANSKTNKNNASERYPCSNPSCKKSLKAYSGEPVNHRSLSVPCPHLKYVCCASPYLPPNAPIPLPTQLSAPFTVIFQINMRPSSDSLLKR